jgi:GNAT superfamily N-acetyltransferase
MKIKMVYRKLESRDIQSYKEARLKAFQIDVMSFSESFEDENSNPLQYFQDLIGFEVERFTLGAFTEDETLIGFASFKRDQRSKARHKSYVSTTWVDPRFRGQGIARSLLDLIIASARKMEGLKQIHLWVLSSQTSVARELYLKAGWRPQGALVKDDLIIEGKFVDAEYMSLQL